MKINTVTIKSIRDEKEKWLNLIASGARKVGECMARLFWKHGAKVVIADIQDQLRQSVQDDIGTEYASYIHCDVSKETDVENAVNTTISKCGKLDIMVNNAAIVNDAKPNILENDVADFESRTNVRSIKNMLSGEEK
ncbi:Secoisolariciresinol dehydrogenase [Glycine soja]